MTKKPKKELLPLLRDEVQFCTECGNDLNAISISKLAKDREALKKNFENCRTTGKFNGDFCSKMFITGDDKLDAIFNESNSPDDDDF